VRFPRIRCGANTHLVTGDDNYILITKLECVARNEKL
jgi:hypothetical protein